MSEPTKQPYGPPEEGIITLAGLRALRLKQRRKEQLPENWKDLVKTYLENKQTMVSLHETRHFENAELKKIIAQRREECKYLFAKLGLKDIKKRKPSLQKTSREQLAEAKRIAKIMGVFRYG